jgi:phage repressor protein C with HTH and peptisase S24 domain
MIRMRETETGRYVVERDDDPIGAADREQPPVLIAADFEFEGMPVVRMRGDSMEDTLRSGDFAVIDTAQTNVSQGGVFVVLLGIGWSWCITQVEPIYGHSTGRIKCTPRNPRYRPFELTLGKDTKIVGRVVERITRHL